MPESPLGFNLSLHTREFNPSHMPNPLDTDRINQKLYACLRRFGVSQCSQEPRRVILSVVRASYSRVLLIAIAVGLLRLFTKNRN